MIRSAQIQNQAGMMHEMKETGSGAGRRGYAVPVLLWLVFAGGLVLQAFSPHLAIEHNSFVITEDSVPRGSVVDPQQLVQRQKAIQGTSAVLVLVGAVGLAYWYRGALRKSLTGK